MTGVYSDLLLHDMGPALADPVEAPPVSRKVGQVMTPSSGYFGGGMVDLFATVPGGSMSEWKTPPLWGCAASAPYLHDGRASTLHDAILLHGGEATGSRNRYAALDSGSKQRLIGFLKTLAPPARDDLPMP